MSTNDNDDMMMDETNVAPNAGLVVVDDDDVDETPQFVTDDDVVEVAVDDNDDVPMEEDDEDDDDNLNSMENDETATAQSPSQVQDVSQFQFASAHKGPVYAVRAHVFEQQDNNNESSTAAFQFSIVSGGGDDTAFWHNVTSTTTTTAASPSIPTTTASPSIPTTTASPSIPTTTASPSIPTTTASQQLSHNHTDSVSAVAWNVPYTTATSVSNNNTNNITKKKTPTSPRLVAVGGYDGAICLYHADNPTQLAQTLEGPTDVECLAWHPKGGTVLLAGSAADGTLWMYHVPNATTQKVMQVFVGHEAAVAACQFTTDGKWALSASSDGTLRQWAPRAGTCKHVFRFQENPQEPPAGLTCLALQQQPGSGSEGAGLVLVGAEDGRAHVCHIPTKKVVATLHHFDAPTTSMQQDNNNEDEQPQLPMSVEAVGFSGDGTWCATGGVDGVLKIWDLSSSTPHCRQVCRARANDNNNNTAGTGTGTTTEGGITRLQWHPTLPLCFTANTQGTVDVWDARNGQLVQSLTGHLNVLNDMDIQFIRNNDVAIVVTASDDESVRVFEVNVAALWNQLNQQV